MTKPLVKGSYCAKCNLIISMPKYDANTEYWSKSESHKDNYLKELHWENLDHEKIEECVQLLCNVVSSLEKRLDDLEEWRHNIRI